MRDAPSGSSSIPPFHVFANRQHRGSIQTTKIATASGHECLLAGNNYEPEAASHSEDVVFVHPYCSSQLATGLQLSLVSEAAATGPRRTPQPTSSERPRARETARDIPSAGPAPRTTPESRGNEHEKL